MNEYFNGQNDFLDFISFIILKKQISWEIYFMLLQ
jgi:hypothetical protein